MLYLPEAAYRGIRGMPELAQKQGCSVWERAETWQHQFTLAQAGKKLHPQAIQLVGKQNFTRTETNILTFFHSHSEEKKLNCYVKLKCF